MAKHTSKKTKTPIQIYKLKIALSGTEPQVWRRVLVPSHFTLEALHSILQLSMGWQMSHLYDFEIGKKRYSDPDEFGDIETASPAISIEAAVREAKSFFYNYDFGDSWRHEIVVEAIEKSDPRLTYPICTGGENACPPEDCGGFPGYDELKKKLSNKKSTDHDEMLRWIGGYFDPHSFDPNRINRDMFWTIDWTTAPNEQGLYLAFQAGDEDRVETRG